MSDKTRATFHPSMGATPREQVTGAELTSAPVYPGRGDRVLRRVVQVLAVVALLEAIVLMTLVLLAGASIADRLGDPGPEPTIGCPFDDTDCGG